MKYKFLFKIKCIPNTFEILYQNFVIKTINCCWKFVQPQVARRCGLRKGMFHQTQNVE